MFDAQISGAQPMSKQVLQVNVENRHQTQSKYVRRVLLSPYFLLSLLLEK